MMPRLLMTIGLGLFAAGILWHFAGPQIEKIGLGSLPGDLEFKGERYLVRFPIVTCLILSVAISILFRFVVWVFSKFH